MRCHPIRAALLILLTFILPVIPAVAGVEAILGKWLTKAYTPNGPLEVEIDLKLNGNELVGTMGTLQGAIPLANLKFEDPDLSIEATFGTMTFKLTGVLKDGKFTGKWSQVGADVSGTWSAERKPSATPAAVATSASVSSTSIHGDWNSVAAIPDGKLAIPMSLKEVDGKLVGEITGPEGTVTLQKVTFTNSLLTFELEVGGSQFRVQATLTDGKLAGKWSAVSGTDTGEWTAERKTP